MSLYTEVLSITPGMAKAFLECNSDNRPLSMVTVDKYAAAMRRGEWLLNGEPIIFFTDGKLGNGQHRLSAIIKATMSIDMLVVRGVASSAFITMDAGKVRGASDVLSISNEKNTIKLAAGARSYLAYGMKSRAAFEITSSQILKAVEDHSDLRYWANQYSKKKGLRAIPASIIGYLAVASEKHGIEMLEDFVEKVGSGIGMEDGDPALLLRERFIYASNKRMAIARTHASALIIKAINAHIKGKKIGLLRYSDHEVFPEIE